MNGPCLVPLVDLAWQRDRIEHEVQAGFADVLERTRVPDRDAVLEGLRAQGIAAAIHYPVPLHRTGAFAYLGYPAGSFPEAELASREILSLPLFPGITEKQQIVVAEAIGKLVS